MSKFCIVALALCLVCLVGATFAQGPVGPEAGVIDAGVAYSGGNSGGGYAGPSGDCPCNYDPWNAIPQPSGLRFMPAGGSTGMPCCGNYNYSWAQCGCARCVHWTQVSWYAQWPHPYDGCGGCGGCGNCGNSGNCGDGGAYCKTPHKQWLH